MIRKFSATWVYTLVGPPLKNGIVSVDEAGFIVDVMDTGGKLTESERLVYHSGLLIPGFVVSAVSDPVTNSDIPTDNLFREIGITGTGGLTSISLQSILAGMMAIQAQFPEISTGELLTRACLHGSKTLGIDDHFGSLSVGKQPGLLLLTGNELYSHRFTTQSRVIRLV
jgi:hypothetical protein